MSEPTPPTTGSEPPDPNAPRPPIDPRTFGAPQFDPATGEAIINIATADGPQSFKVDPERLPQLLAGLDRVREKYEAAQNEAESLSLIKPPAWDEVSKDTTRKIAERAAGGPNSLFDTAQGMLDWVDALKNATQKAIESQQHADQQTRMV